MGGKVCLEFCLSVLHQKFILSSEKLWLCVKWNFPDGQSVVLITPRSRAPSLYSLESWTWWSPWIPPNSSCSGILPPSLVCLARADAASLHETPETPQRAQHNQHFTQGATGNNNSVWQFSRECEITDGNGRGVGHNHDRVSTSLL